MGESQIKVGDVVAYGRVPSGVLIQSPMTGDVALNANGQCRYFASGIALSRSPWPTHGLARNVPVNVIAVGLTGDETDDAIMSLVGARA